MTPFGNKYSLDTKIFALGVLLPEGKNFYKGLTFADNYTIKILKEYASLLFLRGACGEILIGLMDLWEKEVINMDVNTMVNVSTNLSTLNVKQGSAGAAAGAAKPAEAAPGAQAPADAYSVNVTDAAKSHGEAVKGLSAEQIDILQQGIDNSYKMMISVLTENNAKLQGWLDEGIGKLAFGDMQIDSSKFGLPAVGTTPEEAAEAVGEGGEYSVDAVAGRIFDMAKAIAGNDPEKLKAMQDAVEEGFKQAGLAWKETMGTDKMPQITQDTKDEINKRFDDFYAQLTGKAAEEGKSE